MNLVFIQPAKDEGIAISGAEPVRGLIEQRGNVTPGCVVIRLHPESIRRGSLLFPSAAPVV